MSAGSVAVRMLRRGIVAIVVAVLVAGAIRLRGSGGLPPQSGGWRELSADDLR